MTYQSEKGVSEGRNPHSPFSLDTLKKSEVIIIWGKDFHSSDSEEFSLLGEKKIIVIDPFQTSLAKKADLHIQIRPHCDLHLALLLSRFTIIEGSHDKKFLKEYASNYEEFYELTQGIRIKATLEAIGVSLGEIGTLLELIREKRTVILVGSGVQKYQNGNEVLSAIDAFGMILGLFGKHGCGVNYLGSSYEGSEPPFCGAFEFIEEVDLSFEDVSE